LTSPKSFSNNPLDKYMTRVQSGALIGLVSMVQMFVCINLGVEPKGIIGLISMWAGITGWILFMLAIMVYVFTGEYKKPTLRSLLTLS